MLLLSKSERDRLLSKLSQKLQNNADPKTKQWFDNYLKGAIVYRGLKTPLVKTLVKQWHQEHNLSQCELSSQLELCLDLLAGSFAEDKFAGTLYIQLYLLKKIDYQILLPKFDWLFQQGDFYDWSTTDWFCTRILDPLIIKNGMDAATVVASWQNSENLWQRRAAIVAFRKASLHPEYHPLIEQIIATLVKEQERFIQTGIGWVLSDMSKKYPTKVEALFRQYIQEFCKEVIDRHAKYLPCHQELKKLKRSLPD